MRMNVTNLRSFLAVAECGGFTPAATRYGISQPTLTRQVRELEERYGVPLFERTSRRVRLTEAGEQVLEYARNAFCELDRVDQFLRARQRRDLNVFTVRTEQLPRLIAVLSQSAGKQDIRISMLPSEHVYDGLVQGDCHIGFLTLPEGKTDVEVLEIATYPVLAYVSERHPLHGAGVISMADLEGQPIIVAARAAQTRRTFDREIARAGVTVSIVREEDNVDVLLAMVQAGRGIGILGATGSIDPREAHGLRFRETGMAQPLHLAIGPAGKATPASASAFAIMRASVAGAPPAPRR